MVQAYDILALPTFSRWGGTLIGTYVNERSAQYNLLDAVFRPPMKACFRLQRYATERASLSTSRSFITMRAHHDCCKLPTAALLWHRLSAGGNLLCLPDVIEKLRDVVSSGNSDQFEIDSDDRNLQTRRDRLRRHSVADGFRRHRAEAARSVVPAAVRQQPDADVGVRCRDACVSSSVNDAAVAALWI